MRVLCKCVECGNWFQHENGSDDEERIAYLVAAIPRVYDVTSCGFCISMKARNDFTMFMEPFVGVVSVGFESVTGQEALDRMGAAPWLREWYAEQKGPT